LVSVAQTRLPRSKHLHNSSHAISHEYLLIAHHGKPTAKVSLPRVRQPNLATNLFRANSVWQSRSKQQAALRTPQNRSNTASPAPAQQSQTNQPQTKPAQQPGNFWAQRTSQSREPSNGRTTTESAAPNPTTTTFNAAEVGAFLARDAHAGYAMYKVQEAPGGAKSGSGGAWGAGKGES
jgi:hypothetical protein